MRTLACLCVLASSLAAQQRYPVDWAQLSPEILEHFTELLRIDSSNPPGGETKVAKAVQAMLQRDGIPSQLFALEPSRANLVARIKGNGTQRPILIMGIPMWWEFSASVGAWTPSPPFRRTA
jgi:hypothetical protein